MRKFFAMLSASLLLAGSAQAQEAFKHLSAGLDLATTGIGLELALPIVTDHLVITAGYNYANYSASIRPEKGLQMTSFSDQVNQYVDKANDCLARIPGESARLIKLSDVLKVEGDGALRFGTAKAVLEYYPSAKSGFHINAGVYVGRPDFLQADFGLADYWDVYSIDVAVAKEMELKYPEISDYLGEIPELKATIRGRTFQITEPGDVNLGLKAVKVRPYFGLGFGRSIPRTRCGFQFDLGAIYWGRLSITSANEVGGSSEITISNDTVDEILDTVDKIRVYPQMSFRFICRLF